ncbi:carbohydrate ABC transporter permease [Parablautia intestinalis]|uniref:carbohydrate ABC transporter permease n=1 Tax=Parablautia intestinalis TaxID=2320100 RepID=UPI0023BFEEF8|nr:carbohydrate ABC transporter permease [Parablautia intestinalis]MDE7048703.1 carbohydrate ABC transporter permease [Lachnospiraceae bacterium]
MMKAKKIAGTTIKRGRSEVAFSVFNYIFFVILCIIMVYPFWHVVMMSLSSVEATAKGGVFLWPKGFNLDTYIKVFKDPSIWSGYFTTIIVTLAGTFLGTLFTATTAYPLSKKDLPFGKIMLFLVLFTMLFSGGMIPGYLLMKNLNLIDNRLSLVLPGLISAYNVIIMKSFFQSIPESLEESAKIDGATEVTIFWKIVLPLSKATVATIALFTAVGYWNDYFSTVLYINTKERWALQAVLRYMLTNTNQAMQSAGVTVAAATNVTAATIKAASVVVATVPILCVYPFVQKYFVKGVMIGGVKG